MRNKYVNIQKKNKNDIIYTPKPVALKMIEMCDLKKGNIVLDPSKGGGVFYNNFPDYVNKEWCEIEEGVDFFKYNKKVDCILGNPPYSLWTKWIKHTLTITDKFCYIFGTANASRNRLNMIMKEGFSITKIHLLEIDWWFGDSLIIVFEKNKPSIMSVDDKIILCDLCGSRCKRGRAGNDFNKCTNINKNKIL